LDGGFGPSKGYHDFNAIFDAGALNKRRKAYSRFMDVQLETASNGADVDDSAVQFLAEQLQEQQAADDLELDDTTRPPPRRRR
jgi:hypothetical protein